MGEFGKGESVEMGRTAGHDLDHLVLVQHVVHRQHVHLCHPTTFHHVLGRSLRTA